MSSTLEREKRRLERLKKDLDIQQKKLEEEKIRFRQEKKYIESEKNKVQRQEKMLKVQANAALRSPISPRGGGISTSGNNNIRDKPRLSLSKEPRVQKLERELNDYKKRYEMKSKQVSDEKAKCEELESEVRTLKRRLKNNKLNTTQSDGHRVKNLQQEIRVFKKQMKLALKDLDKQRNYYLIQLHDIRTLKVYPKRERLKHKVRIKTEKSEDIVIYIPEVKMWNEGDTPRPDDDGSSTPVNPDKERDLDIFMDEIEKELKPHLESPNDEDVKIENEEEEEEEETEKEEQEKEEDHEEEEDHGEEEDNPQKQINRLLTELHNRTSDLHRIQSIYKDEPPENYEKDLSQLLDQIQNRHQDFINKMEQLHFDPEELKEMNKNWENEIYKFKETVNQIITIAVKAHNDREEDKKEVLTPLPPDVIENETSTLVKESLLNACQQCMRELTGRVSDLITLNDIYFQPEHDKEIKDLPREERLEQLKTAMKDRHRKQQAEVEQMDAVPDDDFLEEFGGCNKTWRNIVYTLRWEFERGESRTEKYVEELQNRTNDLRQVLKVIKGDEASSFLHDVKQGVIERHEKQLKDKPEEEMEDITDETDIESKKEDGEDEKEKKPNKITDTNNISKGENLMTKDNKLWQQIIEEIIQAQEKPAINEEFVSEETDFKDDVIQELLTELKQRRTELLTIKDLNIAVPEECEGFILETETRHNGQKEKLREAKKRYKTTGDEQKDLMEMQKRENMLESISINNKEWQSSLHDLLQNAQQNEMVAKGHQVALEELNGRINDLLKLKHMIEQKNSKETKLEELQKSGEVLVGSMNERHHEVEATVEKIAAEMKSDDQKHDERHHEWLTKLKENNEEWKDAVISSVNTVADAKLPETQLEEKDDIWWLDKDEERKAHIDSIDITPDNAKEVELLGTYINRLFHDSDDPIVCLYTPQPKLDTHHVLSAFYDCELLCELVNLVETNFIDVRVIRKPDALTPYPISNKNVKENVQLLITSLKAFGVIISHEEEAFSKWSNPKTHFEILQKVIDELHTKKLKTKINLKDNPGLKGLKDTNESDEEIVRLSPQDWLKRWLNKHMGKPVRAHIENYTSALYIVMKSLDNSFATSAPVETFDTDPTMASQHMVRFAHTKWGINPYLQANDLIAHHQKLQELFAAQIFEVKSGFVQKSPTEKTYEGSETQESGDDGMISFINSVLSPDLEINDLSRDMSDGIVLCRLLDKLKPGCIHWKSVQMKPRQRFDKMGNCNYAMSVCSKEFPFSLVAIGGDDIHNGNKKMLRSLLWQMMRYRSTKKLSELSFGGKEVKDEDILQWANLTIGGLRDRHSSEIRTFKDKKLTTGVFYLELLKAVLGDEYVRNDLIHFNISILSNPRAPDEHSQERLANVRYAMTILRMNGADLFVLPEDLIALDTNAVLSTLAAIMTIAFTQDTIDHEETPSAT